MSLHIKQREREGIVLDLKGPLTLGYGDLELRDRLPALRESGKVEIVPNLTDVSEIDGTGLGTLVFGLARRRKAGVLAPDILDFVQHRKGRNSSQGAGSAAAC